MSQTDAGLNFRSILSVLVPWSERMDEWSVQSEIQFRKNVANKVQVEICPVSLLSIPQCAY